MPLMIVSGALANKPFNGGEAWVRLSWILGFRKLGCDVYFIEQIDEGDCTDAQGRSVTAPDSIHARFFRDVVSQFGLANRATLLTTRGERVAGMPCHPIADLAKSAAALVNISGHLKLPDVLDHVRRKVYIDIDPGFTQAWHEQGLLGETLLQHDVLFTIAENIGRPGCRIPNSGLPWRVTRQPVVLEEWPVSPAATPHRFTTIARWRGAFGPIEIDGEPMGLKAHEFRKLLALPGRVPESPFEIALSIDRADDADRQRLIEHGWMLPDPAEVASTPAAFREYVQRSFAEFSVAQGVYVNSRSGWFSDRSTRYLASGKPVLLQDTALAGHLPVGDGLLTFGGLDEAVRNVQIIVNNYEHHSAAARALAETHFDSNLVLGRLSESVGVSL